MRSECTFLKFESFNKTTCIYSSYNKCAYKNLKKCECTTEQIWYVCSFLNYLIANYNTTKVGFQVSNKTYWMQCGLTPPPIIINRVQTNRIKFLNIIRCRCFCKVLLTHWHKLRFAKDYSIVLYPSLLTRKVWQSCLQNHLPIIMWPNTRVSILLTMMYWPRVS